MGQGNLHCKMKCSFATVNIMFALVFKKQEIGSGCPFEENLISCIFTDVEEVHSPLGDIMCYSVCILIIHFLLININTASASKVGKFGPFWGEVKKNKRSTDEYLSSNTEKVQLLGAFCERSFSLLDATNAAM